MNIEEILDEIGERWPLTGEAPTKDLMELCAAAVSEHPESSTLWYDFGLLMQRCGEDRGYVPGDYLRCYENAVKCDARNWEAHQEMGYVLDDFFDDYAGAERAFRTAIELGAGAEGYCGLARVLAQSGRCDDAIEAISEAACPFHDCDSVRQMRAEIIAGDWYWG